MQSAGVKERVTALPAELIRCELKKLLGSSEFMRRPQLQRFLSFVVEEELAGRGDQLKEYVLGVGVFGRPGNFDPRLDSLVRVEALRLRNTLHRYYETEGRSDPVIIELQKGSYLPNFHYSTPATTPERPASLPVRIVKSKLPVKRFSRKRLAFGSAILTLIAGAAILLAYVLRNRPALTERDSIVLAEFSNSTGDPVFDDTLKQGLTIELEQSPFLNILSDRRIGQVLKLMEQPASAHLTAEVAREVCVRSDSKAMVAGSISRSGSQYVIGLKALNCNSGGALVHLQAKANNKEAVLRSLDSAASQLRKKLGETLGSIQKFDVPIDEATTPSLDALQAYGMGKRIAREKGSPADIPYYKLAIELDPKFAVAYAALGISYVNLGQPSVGIENLRKAYELRDHVSEREKFRISAYYFQVVTGELEESFKIYELWKQSYPRDYAPYINLGIGHVWLGEYEKAAEDTKKALSLDPMNVLPYSNLVALYIKLGRLQEAEAVLRDARSKNLTSKFLRNNLCYLAFLRGDSATMEQQLVEVKDRPGDGDPLLSQQADTEGYFGRLKNARDFTQRAVRVAARVQAKEAAASWLLNSALREAEFGNATVARKEIRESLQLSSGRDVLALAALASARAGDTASAEQLLRELRKSFPLNTVLQLYWWPTIQAAIELSRKNPQRAIESLQVVSPYELGSPPPIGLATLYPIYLRGEAYLASNQFGAAEGEFQKILGHPSLVLNFPLYPMAYLRLGRARALRGEAGSREAYESFFALWKNADPDIPVLKNARREFAAAADADDHHTPSRAGSSHPVEYVANSKIEDD